MSYPVDPSESPVEGHIAVASRLRHLVSGLQVARGGGGGNCEVIPVLLIEQVFETALLQDGIHPDPAAMAERITLLMQAATGTTAGELDFASAPKVDEPEIKEKPDFDLGNMGIEDAQFQDIQDMIENMPEADGNEEDAPEEEAPEDNEEE